jgi:hypothetical protein
LRLGALALLLIDVSLCDADRQSANTGNYSDALGDGDCPASVQYIEEV